MTKNPHKIFEKLLKEAKTDGYGKVFDDWKGKDTWAINLESDVSADKIL